MGDAWLRRIEFASTISELAGYKSGLTLTQQQMIEHVGGFAQYLDGADDDQIRIRAEEVDELFGDLLFALGTVNTPGATIPGLSLARKYSVHPDQVELASKVAQLFTVWVKSQTIRYDLEEFVQFVADKLGDRARTMAVELVQDTAEFLHKQPWNRYRRVEWKDQADLAELFSSERLSASHGTFFDQRFIDYLYRNFESVDRINWRQFEGFAAEFFDRAGYRVEIGPGRKDDNIDVRVWRSEDPTGGPPAILVQCKRQKEKVGKVVVKALWADVTHECAESGLIVTTSALSPGAKQLCNVRAYPVAGANRQTIKRWIAAMRTPGSGVFMGE